MTAMTRERRKLSDGIRQAVTDFDGPRAALCRAAGISDALLSHFMAHRKGLSISSLDRLAHVLQLDVTTRRKPTGKGKRT